MSDRHLSTAMLPTSEGFSPVTTPEAVATTALPEVVGKLFMLDDTFFRSPFLRDKLPPLLFSNGTSGFDRFFSDFGAPRSARSSFFQPPSDEEVTGASDSGPPTPTNFQNPYHHARFETPEGDNIGVIRNIPIRVEHRNQHQPPEPVAATTAFTHHPTPQFATVTASVHSYPRDTGSITSSSSGTSGVPSKSTYSVPIYQRETSHPVIFRRSQPDSLSLRSAQFPSEDRTPDSNGLYSQLKRSQSSGRVSPTPNAPPPQPFSVTVAPEPPQRRSFSKLLQNQRPTSEVFETTPRAASPTPSMPAFKFDRPTTPLSQKSRPKSPSLQSLRNGFRKATNCVRRPSGNDSDGEGEALRPAPSMVSMQPSTTSAHSSNLYAAISKPTPVSNRIAEIDAVEEAIRSLESFDPSKIIADAAAQENSKNAKVSSGSDSDSGSVIIRKEPPQRSSESPTSSGIVADIRDGSLTRTSGFSNRSSGDSSHEGASVSSSDNDAGSYILVDPQRHQFKPPSSTPATTAALPQPPAISRIAHLGSFGANPQRAVVSSPSSSATSTLTRGDHILPQRATTTSMPTTKTPLPPPPEIVTENVSEEETMQKRMLCAQLTDCAKVIEINGLKMSQFTTSSNWRHPHLLQRNLPGIQDTVYIIEAALDELLEFTQRISIGRSDPKHDEFIQMVAPLRTSQALIHRLRSTLDTLQWNIHSLARLNGNPMANDALDQFVAILHQLPKDCRKLVQWVYLLGTPIAQFLPRHSPGAAPFPVSVTAPEPHHSVPEYLAPRSNTTRQLPPPPPLRQQLSPLPLLTPPTMEEIAMDGGESTTSSNGSSATDIAPILSNLPNSATPTIEQSQRQPTTAGSVVEEDDLVSIADSQSRHVYEEDDLMSVMSESSLYQDYSLLGEHGSLPRPQRSRPVRIPMPKIDPSLTKDITTTERELLSPYAAELEAHMTGLCKLIEEFFHIIEQSREPSNFVQKVRLIILKAQFLVNIGDHMAQCIQLVALRAEFRHSADRLNSLLSQCVSNAQIAKDQYPSVEAVQAMMSSVVAVSDAAQHLKQLGKACV